MPVSLECGDAGLLIEPEIGGAISRYDWRGRDVLRPAAADVGDVLQMACFPLVPFANRIAWGTFDWNGRRVTLQRNFGNHPHPLHGQGWHARWRVSAQESTRAVLTYDHAADDWPWAYSAKLSYSLANDRLHVSLSLTNRSEDSMPASLGFHPFFPKARGTRLTAAVDGMWLTDTTQIPTVLTGPRHFLDFAKGAVLDDAPGIDHCFTGWSGVARIDRPDLHIVLEADARFLQIFVPEGASYFCAEPVSAMPDAVHRPEPARETGLRTLAPGATYAVSMSITVAVS